MSRSGCPTRHRRIQREPVRADWTSVGAGRDPRRRAGRSSTSSSPAATADGRRPAIGSASSRKRSSRCSAICSTVIDLQSRAGQLDRQRDPVQPFADLFDHGRSASSTTNPAARARLAVRTARTPRWRSASGGTFQITSSGTPRLARLVARTRMSGAAAAVARRGRRPRRRGARSCRRRSARAASPAATAGSLRVTVHRRGIPTPAMNVFGSRTASVIGTRSTNHDAVGEAIREAAPRPRSPAGSCRPRRS